MYNTYMRHDKAYFAVAEMHVVQFSNYENMRKDFEHNRNTGTDKVLATD